MRSFTKKPCPGCGNEVAIAPGSVCGNCATAIREYPAARAALSSVDHNQLREYLLGARTCIPSKVYGYTSSLTLAAALSDLLRCVGHATPNQDEQTFHNHRKLPYRQFGVLECEHRDKDCQDWRVHLPPAIEGSLATLFTAIEAVAEEAEAKGQSKGQNLLFQLNSGTLSLTQFNDAAIKGAV